MEEVPLEEAVTIVWEKLRGMPLRSAVSEIFTQFRDYDADDLEYILYELVGKDDWSEASKGVPTVSYPKDSPFYGCQTDSRGYAVDPITQARIPEKYLVSYTSDKKWCFDIRTLQEYWQRTGKGKNPYNNEDLPESVTERLKYGGKSVRVVDGERETVISVMPYNTHGDIIVSIVAAGGELLEDVIKYDILEEGLSLYSGNLDDVASIGDTLTLSSFGNTEYRNKCLLSLFRFCRDRSFDVHVALYNYLGAMLHLTPSFPDKDIPVLETDTVGDVIAKALLAYGGYDLWSAMDVVAEGVSLYDHSLEENIIDVAPDRELRVVPFSGQTLRSEVLWKLLSYNYDEEFVRVLNQARMELSDILENILSVTEEDVATYRSDLQYRWQVFDLVYRVFSLGREGERVYSVVMEGLRRNPQYDESIVEKQVCGINLGEINLEFGWEALAVGDLSADNIRSLVRGLQTGVYPREAPLREIGFLDDEDIFSHYEKEAIKDISGLFEYYNGRCDHRILKYLMEGRLVSADDLVIACIHNESPSMLYNIYRHLVNDEDALSAIKSVIEDSRHSALMEKVVIAAGSSTGALGVIRELSCEECVIPMMNEYFSRYGVRGDIGDIVRRYTLELRHRRLYVFLDTVIDGVETQVVRDAYDEAGEEQKRNIFEAFVLRLFMTDVLYPQVTRDFIYYLRDVRAPPRLIKYITREHKAQDEIVLVVTRGTTDLEEVSRYRDGAYFVSLLSIYGIGKLFEIDANRAIAIIHAFGTEVDVRDDNRIQYLLIEAISQRTPVDTKYLTEGAKVTALNMSSTTDAQVVSILNDMSWPVITKRVMETIASPEVAGTNERVLRELVSGDFMYTDSGEWVSDDLIRAAFAYDLSDDMKSRIREWTGESGENAAWARRVFEFLH